MLDINCKRMREARTYSFICHIDILYGNGGLETTIAN